MATTTASVVCCCYYCSGSAGVLRTALLVLLLGLLVCWCWLGHGAEGELRTGQHSQGWACHGSEAGSRTGCMCTRGAGDDPPRFELWLVVHPLVGEQHVVEIVEHEQQQK